MFDSGFGEGNGKHEPGTSCHIRQGSYPRLLQSCLRELGAKLEETPTDQK